jgi:hypothetical protein
MVLTVQGSGYQVQGLMQGSNCARSLDLWLVRSSLNHDRMLAWSGQSVLHRLWHTGLFEIIMKYCTAEPGS